MEIKERETKRRKRISGGVMERRGSDKEAGGKKREEVEEVRREKG